MGSAVGSFYLLIACVFGIAFLAIMFFYVRNIGQISKLSWVVVRQEQELVQLRKQMEFIGGLDPELIRYAAMLQGCLPNDVSYFIYPWIDKEPTAYAHEIGEEMGYLATCMNNSHYEGLWYHSVLLSSILFQLFTIGWHKDPRSNQLEPEGVLVDFGHLRKQ